VIGTLLQEHPSLRDMITGVGDTAMPHRPEEGGVIPQDATRAFWKGALLGVAAAIVTLGMLVLSNLSNRGSNTPE
jgi:hypothetical protein